MIRRGIPLPPFPEPTHGPRGSKPFATIHDALKELSRRPFLTHNEVPKHCTVFETPRAPYDARTKVLGCITTNGGDDNVHPSGERTFTLRELAWLNGIPLDYQFPEIAEAGVRGGLSKGEILKQIGNCIPPTVWTQFVKSIIDTLEAYDAGELDTDGGIIARGEPRADSARPEVIDLEEEDRAGREVIDLDDDSNDGSAPTIESLPRSLRHVSLSVSRASSRTLSPDGHSASDRPTKRRRLIRRARAPSSPIIDLTGDD